jgi:hypothetical protein
MRHVGSPAIRHVSIFEGSSSSSVSVVLGWKAGSGATSEYGYSFTREILMGSLASRHGENQ